MSSFLASLQQLFGPILSVFHAVFYEPVYNLLMLMYNLIYKVSPHLAFPLAIIGLTLFVRIALIPLTRRQLKSSQSMQALAPKIKEIQAKYKHDPDPQRAMREQQALYKAYGVHPASGCLPLVIQMPFLYSLFFSFEQVLNVNVTNGVRESVATHIARINADIYPFLPHLANGTLPYTHFLWTNLAAADPIHILPILAGLFTFIQVRMALPVKKPRAAGAPKDATTQATQTTQYLMPLITVFFAWQYASGLALYWTIGTMFAATQQYFLGGWGSLFVGIPGMERFVPPPKEPLSLDTLRRTPDAIAGSTVPVLATEVIEEGEVGLAGFFKRIKSSMGAASAVAAEQARERAAQNGVRSGADGSNGATGADGASRTLVRDGAAAAQARERRRAAREAPMLVRPAARQPTQQEMPEEAVARESMSQMDGATVLPEQAMRREGSPAGSGSSGGARPGATATLPADKTTGANGARSTQPSQGGAPKGGARSGQASQASRNRGGRNKGRR